jgi:hypothetical protein
MMQQQANGPGKTELLALMRRYNDLGLLLPRDEHALDDPRARTTVQMVLAEMAEVRREMDAFIAAARVS